MLVTVGPTEKQKPGRFARHVRTAKVIRRQPRTVIAMSRRWIAGLWHAKGGGFYGLGYVATFLWLEFRSLGGEVVESDGVGSFFAGQVFGYLIRFSIESFVNVMLALIWPLLLLDVLGLWAILVVVAGFFAFERIVRPRIETWFPELRRARLKMAAEKAQKAEIKAAKAIAKKSARGNR